MPTFFNDLNLKESFYPFTNTRSVVDMVMGIYTFRERLVDKYGTVEFDSESKTKNEDSQQLKLLAEMPSGKSIELENPWDVIRNNGNAIRMDVSALQSKLISEKLSTTNNIINGGDIFLAKGVKCEFATLNASEGPIYIGADAEIMEGSLIRGPVAICKGAVVKMGSKLYGGTTIGPYCVAGGEIKNSILTKYSNKSHEGYLGDAMIGSWCNLGAGTSNSNVKNTAGVVRVWDQAAKGFVDNGNKCGLLMGDYSRSAINTSFNTGTVVGTCCNIFETGFPSKHIEDFTWGNEKYHIIKAFTDIENWKQLKGEHLTDEEKLSLTKLYSNKN